MGIRRNVRDFRERIKKFVTISSLGTLGKVRLGHQDRDFLGNSRGGELVDRNSLTLGKFAQLAVQGSR